LVLSDRWSTVLGEHHVRDDLDFAGKSSMPKKAQASGREDGACWEVQFCLELFSQHRRNGTITDILEH